MQKETLACLYRERDRLEARLRRVDRMLNRGRKIYSDQNGFKINPHHAALRREVGV